MSLFPRARRVLRRAFRSSPISFLAVAALSIAPATASAATVSGRVVDPDGRPVAAVRIVVSTAAGQVTESSTDDLGRFSIPDVPAGTYDLRAFKEGLQGDAATLSVGASDPPEINIRLRVSAVTESIVVSAAQVEQPVSRTADSVTVITGGDLAARQVETVSDALRLVPALAVTRSGGRGAITSIFPRGGNSNYTLVLVDGIRANSFGGGYDFAHMSVADIDRIEVVRDPESALYGSDAIGAVVQIITRRGGPARVSGAVEGGGQSTGREVIEASGSQGGWSFGGGAEHLSSGGFTGIAPATGETVSNDDYHLGHASGSLGWQRQGGSLDFLMTGNLTHDERGVPGPYGSNPIGAYTGVDRVSRETDDTRQLGGRFDNAWSAAVRQRIDVNYTDIATDYTSPFGPSTTGTHRFEGRVQEDMAFAPALGASAGVEFQREQGSSTYVVGTAGTPIPIDRGMVGTFGELRYAADRWYVAGGVRVEHITRDALDANPSGFPPRPAFPAQTVDSVNPKIAFSYALIPPSASGASTRLRASAGTGIRPPDVFEIGFTNNPNLLPERSQSLSGGIEQQFAGGAYAAGVTAFYNRYDDLIVTVGRALQGASPYVTDNISNARASGVELSGDARPLPGLTLHANYTFLDTEILSVDGLAGVAPPPFKIGDPLIRRPRNQGLIDVTYGAGRITAFGDILMRGQILDVEPNYGASGGLFESPGYTVVNAGVSVRLVRGLDVYARVLNLTNTSYEETLGYPALPRTGTIGVRVAAGR